MAFPEVFAPLAEELILDPIVGNALLSAIGDHNVFHEVRSDPYVPALRLAARPLWDEDRVLGLLGGLGEASTQESLNLLRDLRERLPEEPESYRRWTDDMTERVSRRVCGKPPSESEFEWPEEVRRLQERVRWSREVAMTISDAGHSGEWRSSGRDPV